MANRNLTLEELEKANELLRETRARLTALAGDDADLLFAYRRKIAKELSYDERSKPLVRRKLKALKRKEQGGICPLCGKPLPEKYTVLDRLNAADRYTPGNTRLIDEGCDRRVQAERAFK
jgi:RNA polymerase-binding transcription factor DksA